MRIDNIGAIAESWFDKLTMTNNGARSHLVTLSSSVVTLSLSVVTLSLSKGDFAAGRCA